MVAREAAVGRHEQVAEIGGAAYVAVGHRGDGIDKTTHLPDGVADEHRHEIIAGFHAVDNSGADGIDILQHGAIFDSGDVIGDDGL